MPQPRKYVITIGLALPLAMSGGAAEASFVAYEAAFNITPTVNNFRSALGALNSNDGNHQAAGRREVNWDDVPDNLADPNTLPGNYYNSASTPELARGIELSTPGTGFMVSADSANPGNITQGFGFPSEFIPYSGERLFTPIGSTITDIRFFLPGTTTPGAVGGFGAVFSDVEFTGGSKIELFDIHDSLLFSRSVPTSNNAGLSFLGLLADGGEQIARVRITSGISPLLGHGSYGPNPTEGVAMDDLIYAEPQAVVPTPGTALLLGAGCLAWRGRRLLA